MASVLVHLRPDEDPERCAAPELGRVDPFGLAVFVTVREEVAYIVAVRTGDGELYELGHDITHLLGRLGCPGVAQLADWASRPRFLTPGDADLLAYTLGLELPRAPPLPALAPGSDAAREHALREAVYDDLASDDVRLVYADFLQDRGDPRGELIALQIARARSGGAVTEREQELLRQCEASVLGELAPYIEHVRIERGFLARCSTRANLPPEIIVDRAWSTVEEIESSDLPLLRSPAIRARRLRIRGPELVALANGHRQDLPYETILGLTGSRGLYGEDWEPPVDRRALGNLRAVSFDCSRHECFGRPLDELLFTRLVRLLEHVDIWYGFAYPIPAIASRVQSQRWPKLTIRFHVGVPEDPREVGIAVLFEGNRKRVILELHDPGVQLYRFGLPVTIRTIAGPTTEIEVQDPTRPPDVAGRVYAETLQLLHQSGVRPMLRIQPVPFAP